MDIVIISQYLRNIENLEGNNSRFIYLANMLSQRNNQVEIITSKFLHGGKRQAVKVAQPENFKITALAEPGYPKNICLKRFSSHRVLAKNVKKYLSQRQKPDCIYCAIPSLDVAKVAADYCRKNNVRFIIDIQDLWPESFRMVVNIPVISDVGFAPMNAQANAIYRQADEIVAVSQTYCDRALKVNQKVKKAHPVFLGTKLEVFDKNVAENPPTLKKLESEIWLGYCGTLGHSYDLHCVIEALHLLKENGTPEPKFIVMGGGPKEEEFKSYAEEKQIDAVFTGMLSYPQMCGQIKECDIVVNPIVGSSAASIINKHGDYAASGLPVINTQTSPEYRKLVEEYRMGFNCENGSAQDMADKLLMLIEDEELRKEMGSNARRCAEEKFDRRTTYKEICDLILETANKSSAL